MTDSRSTTQDLDTPRRRGRPRRDPADAEARTRLIRSGLIHLTERGYSAIGVDEVLRHSGVPKGSFYHYFPSKEAFGLALVDAYHAYFVEMLDGALTGTSLPPLDRMCLFIDRASEGMARHGYRRGCLVGNLGQEMSALPESFRARLIAVFDDWQERTARCLELAREQGQIASSSDSAALAQFFWIGWEGAILRAKLEQGPAPIHAFTDLFFKLLEGEPNR
ncbi:TetR/AcrR family transcriptional regulator [Donghicola mangrovi]|uniref:TetR family transcriptional regulator n=1 Tax=Donghicola mangrovi TaxID=2729614 RepID=A0A850QFN7_9RHOB|nr:TetR/AcrR family transcriptional regulator [Donghicola mangrovi]NVO25195.1 TetR family transcriptional regulator [Donghicola mangrovi]